VPGLTGSYRPFDRSVTQVHEADIKAWLIGWDRSLKTKANYHGLLYGVFNHALEQGLITANPCQRTAPKRSRIRQSQADLRFLTEAEFAIAAEAAGEHAGLLTVAVGTGMRFGELTALWVSDVDLNHRTIRINKAWKSDGEDSEQDTPAWLRRTLRAKHQMRGHHLGNPKTPRSRRTIEISEQLVAVLRPQIEAKAVDDFVFTTPTGRPLHNADYYERVWNPLMADLKTRGVAPFRFHDLRHTHVAWLVAGGVPLPHIQARLGPRVHHHHDRHLRPPSPRRGPADLGSDRHRAPRRTDPTGIHHAPHRRRIPGNLALSSPQSRDRRRSSRTTGETRTGWLVTGCSPAWTSSSRYSRVNRTCFPIRAAHPSLPHCLGTQRGETPR
jgi:integrase